MLNITHSCIDGRFVPTAGNEIVGGDAVSIANDSPYGLQAYVFSEDIAAARRVAARLQAQRSRLPGDQRRTTGRMRALQ